MYILDTNTIIYYFKGMGNVADNLLSHSPREVYIPSIVLFEIEVGILKSTSPSKRLKQLSSLLSNIDVLSFGPEEAHYAAQIRADLEQRGLPIGDYDTLIAGLTLARGGVLVTHNIREFSRVSELRLEDWYV